MEYSIEGIKKAGVLAAEAKIESKDPSFLTKVAKSAGIAELGSPAFLAVCLCLEEGKWSRASATKALVVAESTLDFIEVQAELLKAGVLGNYEGIDFSPEFLAQKDLIAAQMVKYAPALMLPVTETTDWVHGESHQTDLNLVARRPDSFVPQRALDAVNKLQDVMFRLSPDVLPVIQQQLDKQLAKAAKYKNPSKLANREIVQKSNLKEHLIALEELGAVQFHVTMDFRGRMYYRGGIFTPQGDDFQKALWQFANPVALGKSGRVALAIHYANVYGMDKESMASRITWAGSTGTSLSKRVAQGTYFPETADKPWQTIVAANEWYRLQEWIKAGNKEQDFMSTLVCHMDGTCNGLQHGAAITGCRDTAESVNCTAATRYDVPQDVYKRGSDALVAELMNAGLVREAEIVAKYGRKAMKLPVMTASYGAGIKTLVKGMLSVFSAEERKIFQACDQKQLQRLMERAIKTVASATLALNKELQGSIEEMESADKPIVWITEDGFVVSQEGRTKDREEMQYVGAGRYRVRTDAINERAQINGISANFVHSLDAAHLRAVVRSVNCELVTVHDSIGSHAGDFMHVFKVVREQFIVVHQHDQFASLNNLNGLKAFAPQLGDYSTTEVKQATYFFS